MRPGGELWKDLQAEQDRALAAAGYLDAARARWPSRSRRSRPQTRRRWAWAALTPSLAAAAFGLWWSVSASTPKELAFVVGAESAPGRVGAWIASPAEDSVPLRFADGTLVRLAPGSRARIASANADGARVVLERGSASAAVVHRAKSHWTFDVGPFVVDVIGTRFDASWDDQVFRVGLHEGTVRVSGPCIPSPRLVSAGHDLEVSCGAAPRGRAEVGAAASAAESPVAAAEPPPGDAPDARHSERGPGATSHVGRPKVATHSVLRSDEWRALTSTGRNADALELVEAAGFDAECAAGTGADLVDLGDVARFARKPARARQAYLAARAKIAAGGRTAYSLGLLAFDQEGNFAAAARWFDTYLGEQPNGELRSEAMGRLIEAWHLAGNDDLARAAAERYLAAYPNGLNAPLARKLRGW